MDQLMGMQAQLMQAMMQRMDNEPVEGLPPVHVRDKHGEFMKRRPPVFTQSIDPLDADDWLRTVEKQLDIAQCNDMEKVLYASGQLQGAAQDWWVPSSLVILQMPLLLLGLNLQRISYHTISLRD
jgi:NACalpha-BTF3-like transcription factor